MFRCDALVITVVAAAMLMNVPSAVCGATPERTNQSLHGLTEMAGRDDKPFCVVWNVKGAGQGVVVSAAGHIVTAAHVTYDADGDRFPDEVDVSFRKHRRDPWPGAVRQHENVFLDAGHASFFEETHTARLLKKDGRVHIDEKDVAVLKMSTPVPMPFIPFYSRKEPEIRIGDRFYLCQFTFPTHPADPTFLVSAIDVIGVARAVTGVQVLVQGFFRFGGSGGAILKDGKLIGIQSNGFTVNAKEVGEVPLGHFSFQVVWEDLVAERMKQEAIPDTPAPENPAAPGPVETE